MELVSKLSCVNTHKHVYEGPYAVHVGMGNTISQPKMDQTFVKCNVYFKIVPKDNVLNLQNQKHYFLANYAYSGFILTSMVVIVQCRTLSSEPSVILSHCKVLDPLLLYTVSEYQRPYTPCTAYSLHRLLTGPRYRQTLDTVI